MSNTYDHHLLSWRVLPNLVMAGLCVGFIAGIINYKPADGNLRLSPGMAKAAEVVKLEAPSSVKRAAASVIPSPNITSAQNEVSASNDVSASNTSVQPRPVEWNTAAHVFAPTHNYQVPIADSLGVRLKTIVTR